MSFNLISTATTVCFLIGPFLCVTADDVSTVASRPFHLLRLRLRERASCSEPTFSGVCLQSRVERSFHNPYNCPYSSQRHLGDVVAEGLDVPLMLRPRQRTSDVTCFGCRDPPDARIRNFRVQSDVTTARTVDQLVGWTAAGSYGCNMFVFLSFPSAMERRAPLDTW